MIDLATSLTESQLPGIFVPPKVISKVEGRTIGRPTVITKDVLQKLEDGFMIDLTDEEACLYAGISPGTLYNYQKQNPEFLKRKEALRLTPNLHAKKELVSGIKGSLEQARWWAINKMGNQYGAKSTIQHNHSLTVEHKADPEMIKLNEDYNKRHREILIGRIATKEASGQPL